MGAAVFRAAHKVQILHQFLLSVQWPGQYLFETAQGLVLSHVSINRTTMQTLQHLLELQVGVDEYSSIVDLEMWKSRLFETEHTS